MGPAGRGKFSSDLKVQAFSIVAFFKGVFEEFVGLKAGVVPGQHNVVNVHVLDEDFHGIDSLLNFLLVHLLSNFLGISGNTGQQDMGELFVIGSVFVDVADDGFFTGVATSSDNDNFTFL